MPAPRLALFLPKLSLYGGAERFGHSLASHLAQEGFAVDFVCSRQEVDPPKGVRVVNIRRLGLVKTGKMLWFAWACERVRRRGRYDLTIGLGKSFRQDLLRISGGPLANFWELSKRAWPEGFPRSFKMLRRRLSPANHLTRSIEPRQLKNARAIVVVSHLVRDWLLSAYPFVDPDKVHLIYNRPDLSLFSPALPGERERLRKEAHITAEQVVILTAGSNFGLKGLGTLIRALPLLPGTHVLHVAGDRNPHRWQRLAKGLGVSGRVHFLGKVSDMASAYRRSDLFCLPSMYDACSNAVLEGLACGLPVVSSRDNGSSFFLPDHAVADNPEDHRELAERIATSLSRHIPDTPFAWPDTVASGLPAYADLVRSLLNR